MLDQLVAFCGNEINETNVLDIFGFTSRETVAALLLGILQKEPAKILAVIYEQFEKGKDLGQLLAEVVGAIRALVVAKLDPNAGHEGFPEALWTDLATAAESIKPDRLLAVIDTFSEAESRMKWASNKRLHLEIASLKAVQNLKEIRLTDIITAIGKADPEEIAASLAGEPTAPPVEATPSPTSSEPEKKTSTDDSALDPIDRLIANAPDDAVDPEPVKLNPEPEPVKLNPEPEPAKEQPAEKAKAEDDNTAEADEFHNDPLIIEALKVFKGRLIS
jgi:DNA polymerase-3 subunit gamma/tau